MRKYFEELKKEWKASTSTLSSKVWDHPSYHKIIDIGPAAVHYILEALEKEPDHWFHALRILTKNDPVPPEDCGKIQKMREHWLQWGRKHGYKIGSMLNEESKEIHPSHRWDAYGKCTGCGIVDLSCECKKESGCKAKLPCNGWTRLRFKASPDDYRPIKWPPLGPYWCSGYGDGYNILVAYIPSSERHRLTEFWPEAEMYGDETQHSEIIWSDRFYQPDWWPNT